MNTDKSLLFYNAKIFTSNPDKEFAGMMIVGKGKRIWIGSEKEFENKRNFFDVSADVLENVDPIFYGDLKTAAFKGLGLG